ncbi:DUF742 domain-containing protein [Streptosporangium longisporum]|uniref:DUF742 domain-containing protein n=1 Tax=Streptosporangium longisporum TaxID=46187 RepID=A0ABN3XRB8_9ACTN
MWGDVHGTGQRSPSGHGPAYGEPADEESSLVRLYAVTGGRTVPSATLAMEALVSTSAGVRLGLSYAREYRLIGDLCRRIRSVAEISALLGVPLGVTRVLVSDMEAEGLVRVHRPRLDAAGPGPDLLERVLNGLDRL